MENQVFVNLLRKGYDPEKTMFYYRTRNDKEIDFVLRENNRVKDDQEIYFRFTRRSLISLANYGTAAEEGNADDMGYGSMSFRYNNYTLESTSQYGYGIQMPLAYLGIDCVVNLIVKSQYGFSEEIANVIPYLYRIRYYKGKI